jgi:hypothetical protein
VDLTINTLIAGERVLLPRAARLGRHRPAPPLHRDGRCGPGVARWLLRRRAGGHTALRPVPGLLPSVQQRRRRRRYHHHYYRQVPRRRRPLPRRVRTWGRRTKLTNLLFICLLQYLLHCSINISGAWCSIDVSGGRSLRSYYSDIVAMQGVGPNLPPACTARLDTASVRA